MNTKVSVIIPTWNSGKILSQCLESLVQQTYKDFEIMLIDNGSREAVKIMSAYPNQELILASPREPLNIHQVDEIGCHVITVTHDILKKLSLVGKDLDEYSLDTVKMFRGDAQKAGYQL